MMAGDPGDPKQGASELELRAAEALGVQISAAFGERPLARTWRATGADGKAVALVVVRHAAPKAERDRFGAAAERLRGLGDARGLLRVRAVSPSRDAYLADLWTTGTAKDLDVLEWPVRRRLEFVRAVAQALDSLHKVGGVHGCLCDENILLADDLTPVLAEAGSVSVHDLAERGGDAASYTAFAAPELDEGAEPDVRSDIYALGRLIQHVLRTDDVPQVADVLGHCLAPAPAGRYETAADFGAALDVAIEALPKHEPPVVRRAPPPPPTKPAERKLEASGAPEPPRAPARWPAPAGAVMVAASVAGAFLGAGTTEGMRALLSGALMVGVGLVAWSVRPHPRTPDRLRVAFAVTLAVVVMVVNPFAGAYRAATAHTIAHGDPDARRAAIAEIKRHRGDFSNMSLAGADLSGADLRGVDLRGADLSGSDLSNAALWGAVLDGTSLDRAKLLGTDLRLSDFGDALHIDTAECDAKTLLPDPWRCTSGHPKEESTPAEP